MDKPDFKSILNSNKLRAIGEARPVAESSKGEDEFKEVRKQLGVTSIKQDKIHKDRKIVKKPTQCWIYICEPITAPGMLLTQVRHTQFTYLDVCQEWCEANCVSYTIKDLKGNILIKK